MFLSGEVGGSDEVVSCEKEVPVGGLGPFTKELGGRAAGVVVAVVGPVGFEIQTLRERTAKNVEEISNNASLEIDTNR